MSKDPPWCSVHDREIDNGVCPEGDGRQGPGTRCTEYWIGASTMSISVTCPTCNSPVNLRTNQCQCDTPMSDTSHAPVPVMICAKCGKHLHYIAGEWCHQ